MNLITKLTQTHSCSSQIDFHSEMLIPTWVSVLSPRFPTVNLSPPPLHLPVWLGYYWTPSQKKQAEYSVQIKQAFKLQKKGWV